MGETLTFFGKRYQPRMGEGEGITAKDAEGSPGGVRRESSMASGSRVKWAVNCRFLGAVLGHWAERPML